jgi:hypothetical protein
MNNTRFRKARQFIFALSAFMLLLAACKDDDTKNKTVYDPNRPVELVSFKPDSGRISEMVLLDGSNFGSDVSKIKVFFNAKEAIVINSTGTRILALVPRLPGDNCVVSVEVDGKKSTYPNIFRYKIEASVTTIAGDGTKPNPPVVASTMDQSQFQPVYMGIDKDNNLFVTVEIPPSDGYLLKLNVDENTATILATSYNHGLDIHSMPYAHPETGMLLLGGGGNGNRDLFLTLDPKEGWAPKNRYIKNWTLNGFSLPASGQTIDGWAASESHYNCLYCEADEHYYTRYLTGQIVKINPKTWDAEIIAQTNSGFAYGMAFHPIRQTELWLGYEHGHGGELANSLCRLDVTDPAGTFEKMSGLINGGFRDGPLEQAQFKQIRMINFDADGNLFVGDGGNSCIRKVDTETMMVETLIGIPQKSGFKDGKKEDALFSGPHGLVVDAEGVIYIADYNNCRIRRIAIE